jgi:hypothetical protein
MFCVLSKKKRCDDGSLGPVAVAVVRVFSFIARCTLHVSFASGVSAGSYGVVPLRKQESVQRYRM